MLKSPEEIKKGLKCCLQNDLQDCAECPYVSTNCSVKNADALAYIEQLESDLERANNIIMQVKAMLDDDGK